MVFGNLSNSSIICFKDNLSCTLPVYFIQWRERLQLGIFNEFCDMLLEKSNGLKTKMNKGKISDLEFKCSLEASNFR